MINEMPKYIWTLIKIKLFKFFKAFEVYVKRDNLLISFRTITIKRIVHIQWIQIGKVVKYTIWEKTLIHCIKLSKLPTKKSSSSSITHASNIFNCIPGKYSCTVENLAIGALISSVQNKITTIRWNETNGNKINLGFNCLNLKGEMNIRTLWISIDDLIHSEVPWIKVWIRMKININIQTLYSIKPWFQFKALNTKSFKPVNKRKKTSIVMIATRHFCIGPKSFSLLKLIISRIAAMKGNTQKYGVT